MPSVGVQLRRRKVDDEDVEIPAGEFLVGDGFDVAYPGDRETPVHRVRVDSFLVGTQANQHFAHFIQETGYRTDTEQDGTSAVFHLVVKAAPNDVLGLAAGTPWWLNVRGATSVRPQGLSRTGQKFWTAQPCVFPTTMALNIVNGQDGRCQSKFSGNTRRGGLNQHRYPWGNDLHGADGRHVCNIWQSEFPENNTKNDGLLSTALNQLGAKEAK